MPCILAGTVGDVSGAVADQEALREHFVGVERIAVVRGAKRSMLRASGESW
jgi:hypothetical protein